MRWPRNGILSIHAGRAGMSSVIRARARAVIISAWVTIALTPS